jgi:hypothetical protein
MVVDGEDARLAAETIYMSKVSEYKKDNVIG